MFTTIILVIITKCTNYLEIPKINIVPNNNNNRKQFCDISRKCYIWWKGSDIGAFKYCVIIGFLLILWIKLVGGPFAFISLSFYEIDYSTANLSNYCNDSIPHFIILCITNCSAAFVSSVM